MNFSKYNKTLLQSQDLLYEKKVRVFSEKKTILGKSKGGSHDRNPSPLFLQKDPFRCQGRSSWQLGIRLHRGSSVRNYHHRCPNSHQRQHVQLSTFLLRCGNPIRFHHRILRLFSRHHPKKAINLFPTFLRIHKPPLL